MKYRGSFYLLVFAAFVLIVGLACQALSGGGASPTQAPVAQPPQATQPPVQQSTATEAPATASSSSGGLTTFVDEKKLLQIEVPSDWKYEHNVVTQEYTYYTDTFTSPDGGAVVESLVYDDGKAFTGNDKGRFALALLNKAYSKTGKEGDIRVSDDSIQKDGSERLTWSSKQGKYSGISFFEVRSNNTTFLMFTVDWGDALKDQYIDTLNKVIESYSIP